VRCQLDHLAGCLPECLEDALNDLPETLFETYERTLQTIDTNWKSAHRLLQCVAVASRPLRVDELADILAFDFEVGPIPEYREGGRVENPVNAVLSMCSTLVSVVDIGNYREKCEVIQFSHFSIKEFLMSKRFADKGDDISSHFHILNTPAHTLIARACLGILLHLDKNITKESLKRFPLAQYAVQHWIEHARFEGVSQNVAEGMKQLFDQRKPHLAVWLSMYDSTASSWTRHKWATGSLPLHGTPLHYAAFCGLDYVVEVLANESPEDMDSQNFDEGTTPLHLASEEGHVAVARLLVNHGASLSAQTNDGWTPLHVAIKCGYLELVRLFLEHGASVSAQIKDGWSSLDIASERGDLNFVQLLLEHGADPSAQNMHVGAPLHLACLRGDVKLAHLLIENGADPATRNVYGGTPLHRACWRGHVQLAQLLLEHGADPASQTKDGWTPLHLMSDSGYVELARLLVKHGADAATSSKDGWTPLRIASKEGHVGLIELFSKQGIDTTAQAEVR
jgi:ankyrin repeat protein